MDISSLRRKIQGESLWFCALVLLLIPVYLGQFSLGRFSTCLVYATSLLAYLMLALKLYILDGRGKKELILITLTLGLLAVGVVASGTRSLFSTALLAFSAKDVSFSKIARVCFCFFAGAILLNAILVLLGILEDTVVIRGELIGYGNRRHTLGFGYPNTLALWGMVTVFAALLVPKKGLKTKVLCGLFALSTFLLTDSKAAFLSSCVAIFLCALVPALERHLSGSKSAPAVAAGLVALAPILFILLSLLYRESNPFFGLLNTLFSQRLGYAGQGFRSFGVSLFGAHVDFGWDPVDSLYAYGPICLGVVPSFLYLTLCVFGTYRAAKAYRWEIVAVALAGMLYSTMEYSLINPIFLPVFAACALLENRSQNI